MAEFAMPHARHAAGRPSRSIVERARGAIDELRDRMAARRTIATLRSLDDRALADIGLHRSESASVAWGIGCDRIRRRQD